MGYEVLASAILVLHFAFLGYVVLGGVLAWRWSWAIWPHLAAAAWGVLIVAYRLTCPLTVAEDWARRRAGEAGLAEGFIDSYIEGVLYPQRYADAMRAVAAVVVLASWLVAVVRWRSRQIQRSDTVRRNEESSRHAATV